ncbi:MAG: tRNA (N6-isopentenyl adenosine(37)-C2)-methylthiotransferase MiaB [Patescibacteria group bacterium]|nr:tRNA (N6-isopentenyl adenosine(37)-C2)-methylthiotransferase MiaB [Patescibacteria group bacterium]
MKSPRFYVQTYGCQMNSNDSERLAGLLKSIGFEASDKEEDAQLVIFNTCSVREHAEERVYGRMESLVERKKKGEDVLIAVTGCMAGRDKNGVLRRRLSMADLFFATPDMVNLPRWIAEFRPNWMVTGNETEDYLKIKPLRQKEYQAYVTIQTGCNHFCTYCVVPYARGLERNRPAADILTEIKDLAARGISDVTLLGQAVNDYIAPDPGSFSPDNPCKNHYAALLWEINQIDGVKRLHWTAAHPLSMSDEVIQALTFPKQVNYLHLPVQSGSNEILRRMNRKYSREQYLEIIRKVKEARPGIALGTDIIVGFPGETEQDFQDTVDLYKACDFDISYTAQYSPRSGTLSFRLYPDNVSEEEKKRRWQILQDLMEENTLRKNQAFLDKTVEVFIEKIEGDFAYGTSSELKSVKLSGAKAEMLGQIVLVKIQKAMTWQLEGEIIQE